MARPFFTTWSQQHHRALPEILEGNGARFRTAEGWWLDLASLSYQANLGHGHPRMVEAIKRQADRFCLSLPNHTFEAKEKLAEKLLDLAPPGFDKVFFTLGGSEAVENAIKIAKLATGRSKLLARYRSYHGASAGALSLSGDYRRPPLEPMMPGVVHVVDGYAQGIPLAQQTEESAAQFERVMALEGEGSVAAVFCEPIPGANGVLIPPAGYWKRLREACDKHGALLVADEVLTGFGRTGRWLGVDHEEGVVPDMITMAKGLTGGYAPLGAVLVHERVSRVFYEQKLYCGLTYYGHPLSCAAGAEAIDVYREEGLIERAASLESAFASGLAEVARAVPGEESELRVRGLLGAVEWRRGREERWKPFFSRLSQLLVEHRIHCYPKPDIGLIVFAPPLVIEEERLKEGMTQVAELVAEAWSSSP